MPIFKVKGIFIKLYEDDVKVEVLNKKTGEIETVFKSRNESKYNYYLNKQKEFYTLQVIGDN